MQLVNQYTADANRWWIVAAIATGLLSVILPPMTAILLIMSIGFIFLLTIEPAIGIIAMLILAPLKSLIETELIWNLPLDIGQLLFVIAVGAWLFHRIIHRRSVFHRTYSPIVISLLIFLFVTALSIPNAYSVGVGIREWIKWAEILVIIIVVSDMQDRLLWLVSGLIFAGVAQALIGIFEFQGGSGAPHLWILDYQYFRAFGTFGQPNPFGAFMGMILPLSIALTGGYAIKVWQDRSKNEDATTITTGIAFAVAMLIILGGLLVSWSRGAWLGFAVASVILLWLMPLNRKHGTGLVVIGGAGGLVLWVLGLLPTAITNRILSFTEDFTGFGDVRGVVISDENFAVVERLAHWQSAVEMAAARPLLGVGFGNYEAAYPNFDLINWPLALGHAHNYYLNLLAEVGMIGLLAYLLLWFVIIQQTWLVINQNRSIIQRSLAVGLMGVWVHVSVHHLVDKLYVNNLFLHLGVMIGILALLQSPKQTNETFKELS